MWKRVIGSIIGLMVVVGLAGFFLATRTSTIPPSISTPAPPAEQAAAENRIKSALKSPAPSTPTAQTAAPSSTASTMRSVKFDEADLNTVLTSDPQIKSKMAAEHVKAVQIAFKDPDIVEVRGWMDMQGATRQITVNGVLSPDGSGGVSFKTTDTQVGMLPLPSGITQDQINHFAAEFLAQATPQLPIKVQSLSVDGGKLVLTGTNK